MFRLTELDVRKLEHDRRVDAANQNGWLRSSGRGTRRRVTFGAVFGAIAARLALRPTLHEGSGIHLRPDAVAAESGAGSPV